MIEYNEKQVILSLVEFEEMRKEIKTLEEGNVVEVSNLVVPSWGTYPGQIVSFKPLKTFMTKDETIKEIAKENENLLKRIDELEKDAHDNYSKQSVMHQIKNKTIFDVRNMTIWEFLEWRKR